jgi:hypothetical protein
MVAHIPDHRLFDANASAADILEDVGGLMSALSTHQSNITDFIRRGQRGRAELRQPRIPCPR